MKPHGIGWLNGHLNDQGIEYKPETWNPVSGCSPVSEGCENCYAATMGNRLKANPRSVRHGKDFSEVMFHQERLAKPLHWKKPRVIFANSMSDLFHESVTFEQIAAVFGIMAATPQHKYFVLTKRPKRMKSFFEWVDEPGNWALFVSQAAYMLEDADTFSDLFMSKMPHVWPLPNVIWGVSAENQEQADKRIPILLDLKAGGHISKAMVSIEPMLDWIGLTRFSHSYGPVHGGVFNALTGFVSIYQRKNWQKIAALDWVIVGGETSSKARPMHPDWVRAIRDQCKEAGTPFYFKQWGEWLPDSQREFARDQQPWGLIHKSGPFRLVWKDGKQMDDPTWKDNEEGTSKVDKKTAGHLLDGVEHKEIPK